MRSSISVSSLPSRATFFALIGALAVFFISLELGARAFVPRISKGISRISMDMRSIERFSAPRGDRLGLLIVGNSLLVEGVNRERLTSRLGESADIQLFPIEATSYLDWYFGLKRFLSEGKMPTVVVVCLNVRQMLSDSTNGPIFARFLMRLSDLIEVKRASSLDMMRASEYMFSNGSFWLATRSNVRNGVMSRVMPMSEEFLGRLAARDDSQVSLSNDSLKKLSDRLGDLKRLTAEHGVELAWLVPASRNVDDWSPAIRDLAVSLDIEVLVPVLPGEMPSEKFADGFHLNAAGARAFTDRIVPEVDRFIAKFRGKRIGTVK